MCVLVLVICADKKNVYREKQTNNKTVYFTRYAKMLRYFRYDTIISHSLAK